MRSFIPLATLVCYCSSFCISARASTLDRLPPKFDIRIEMGRSDGNWQKESPIVARKLQRWLENLDGVGSVRSGVSRGSDQESFQRAYLDYLLTQWENDFIRDGKLPRKPADLGTRILRLKSEQGVRLFRWHRLQAMNQFLSGKMELAARLRRDAWELVPSAGDVPDWESLPDDFETLSSSESRNQFFKWWDEHAEKTSACRVRLREGQDLSLKSVWHVNGFRVPRPENGELSFSHGVHELKVDKEGFETWIAKVDCRRPGLKEMRVELTARLLAQEETTTVLRVEPEKNEIRLFLHTPGVAFHEISTTGPLRVVDLTHQVSAEWPVATDAFLELLSEHKIAANLSSPPTAVVAPPAEIMTSETKPQWYEDWRFWTIVGVVGAGITAGILASDHSKVESNRGWVSPRRK